VLFILAACAGVLLLAGNPHGGEHLRELLAGYWLGAIGYLTGLALSALLDLPSGAVIVWTLALVALATSMLLHRRAA